ncbi:MAG TPA: glycosyltransferase [Anaeromyxobacter sp.]|nr:glycosyltransferase [Anaeromyxobacter sp.]
MSISIVLLTHRRPDALALVLLGLARQRVPPLEVVVTEDGTEPETRQVVDEARACSPVPIIHLTQEHRGPRMSRARNRGVARASSEYVVFLDGDMVPGRDFVADHRDFARPGCLAQGSRVLAPEAITRALIAGRRVDVPFLAPGLGRRRHLIRAPFLRDLWGRPHHRRAGAKSCNLAFWREDLLRLNGFNEGMEGWGLEDAEIVQRAFHLGLWRRDLRMGAVAVHLWHPPHQLGADNPNWAVIREVEASRATRCEQGLAEHLG